MKLWKRSRPFVSARKTRHWRDALLYVLHDLEDRVLLSAVWQGGPGNNFWDANNWQGGMPSSTNDGYANVEGYLLIEGDMNMSSGATFGCYLDPTNIWSNAVVVSGTANIGGDVTIEVVDWPVIETSINYLSIGSDLPLLVATVINGSFTNQSTVVSDFIYDIPVDHADWTITQIPATLYGNPAGSQGYDIDFGHEQALAMSVVAAGE